MNDESEEIQEVAEPELEEETLDISEENQDVAAPEEEIADEKPKFTKQDSEYAQARRTGMLTEFEKVKKENQKLMEAIKSAGFNGKTSDELVDELTAHVYSKDIDDVRNERILKEQEEQKQSELISKLSYYEKKEAKERMDKDLAGIQAINPNIKKLSELGQPYLDLVKKGIDGVTAYKILDLDGLIKNKTAEIEQETLKKIAANTEASSGSLSGADAKPKSYANMNKKEFDELVERAKRGELRV